MGNEREEETGVASRDVFAEVAEIALGAASAAPRPQGGEGGLTMEHVNVNGIALLVALVHAVVVGVVCYAWGYTDGAARRRGGAR